MADPTGDLPYSRSEAAGLLERLAPLGRVRTRLLLGAQATRDAVLRALETDPYNVIHFSCHADFFPHAPARSCFRLFDGNLTAEDLYQADMARAPALCVLNACESGRSGGTAEIAGLSSALTAAGAGAVVAARWPIHNKSAAFWIASLYAGLASGDTVGEAMARARRETRRLFANDPLLTWAAFALDGAPWTRHLAGETRVTVGRGPLVGREAQWRDLHKAWEECRSGHGRTVVLTGPPGSGRTRLMNDWLASLPEGVVRAPDSMEVGTLEDARKAALERGGAVLAVDTSEEEPSNREAILGRALGACRDAPLLVLATADDAQSLPQGDHCLRVLPVPLLDRAAASTLFAALGAEAPEGLVRATPADVERLALGLPRGETAAALAAALEPEQRSALRAGAVWGVTFAAEEAAALLEVPTEALWRPFEALCAATWIVEESPGVFRFRDATDRQAVLDALQPAMQRVAWERRAAERCAARGEPGPAGLHWRAAGDTDNAAARFEEAVRKASPGAEALRWRDELIAIAPEPDDTEYAGAAASSLEAAGRWTEARTYWERVAAAPDLADAACARALLAAAECAVASGELPVAAERLEEAVRLAGQSPASLCVQARLLLARCLPTEAMEVGRRAIALARGAGSPGAMCSACAISAAAALLAASADEAAAFCHIGLEAVGDAPGACRTALLRSLAQACQYAGDYEAAIRIFIGLADEQGASASAGERAATLLALAQVQRDQGRLDRALDYLDNVAGLPAQQHAPAVASEERNLRSSVYRRQGRYAEALSVAETGYQVAAQAGLVPEAIRADIHIATALAEQGRLAEARDRAASVAEEAHAAGYDFGAAWADNVAGMACLDAGDLTAAESRFTAALTRSRDIRGHIGIASALLYLGWVAWLRGEPAGHLFVQAEEAGAVISYLAVQLAARFGAALCNDDRDATDQALGEIEGLNMGAVVPWLREKRGSALLALGRFDDALRDLAPAYRVAKRMGMEMVQARTAAALVSVYAATGGMMTNELQEEAAALRVKCLQGW